MRKTLLSTIILAASCYTPLAQATEHWVQGVKEQGGWKDVNKSSREYTYEGNSQLCWAAAASNVISWWQEQNSSFLKAYSTDGIPQGEQAIFKTFNDRFKNEGFDAYCGLRWFMDGGADVFSAEYEEGVSVADIFMDSASTVEGGFYSEILPNVETLMDSFTQFTYSDPLGVVVDDVIPLSVFTSNLVNAIDGGCGVALGLQASYGGHAITLWGVDVNDDTGYIDYMWVTDSDDAVNSVGELGLIKLECSLAEMKKQTGPDPVADLQTYTVYEIRDLAGESGGVWYHGQDEYIDSFATLKTVAYQGVPEPATGTLSLLALAALAARRRRKG